MNKLQSMTLATLPLTVGTAAQSQSFTGSGYLASELLSPCQEADNDARWGEAAETRGACRLRQAACYVGGRRIDGDAERRLSE